MKIKTKLLLLISLTALLIGFATNVLWGIGLPLGAVLFGLFLIFKLLEKETAKFDEEQHLRLELAGRDSLAIPTPKTADRSSNHRIIPARVRVSA